MGNNNPNSNPISILKTSFICLIENKIILFPFFIIAFFQLLALEIIYFIPRHPFNIFLGPIIKKIYGEAYLHYPMNLMITPKLYQNVQIPLYIFISSFFIAMAIKIIHNLNNGEKIKIKDITKKVFSQYIFVVIATLIGFSLVMLSFKGYGLILKRAAQIQSTEGIYFILKTLVINGAPYAHLILNILITTLFAYLIPAVIIDSKKIFSAIILNFKTLWKSFWITFIIILIPSMFFIPILIIRSTVHFNTIFPELHITLISLSILLTMIIDAIVYTSITTFYLIKKESK